MTAQPSVTSDWVGAEEFAPEVAAPSGPKMKGNDTTPLRAKLLARGQTFASIAQELGLSRQHVREVAAGIATSARVSAALEAAVKRKPIAA